jgi:hypothetical protein
MSTTRKIPGAIIAVLATGALAAPAGAMPIHDATEYDAGHASTAKAAQAAQAKIHQDLRSPDARDAAIHHRQIESSAAAAFAGKSLPAAPTWATSTQTLHSGPTPVSDDDGTPWTTIALGIAGAGLAFGGAAGIARTSRVRARRARVAA